MRYLGHHPCLEGHAQPCCKVLSTRSNWQTGPSYATCPKPIAFQNAEMGMRVRTCLCAGDDAAGGRDAGAADERAEDGAARAAAAHNAAAGPRLRLPQFLQLPVLQLPQGQGALPARRQLPAQAHARLQPLQVRPPLSSAHVAWLCGRCNSFWCCLCVMGRETWPRPTYKTERAPQADVGAAAAARQAVPGDQLPCAPLPRAARDAAAPGPLSCPLLFILSQSLQGSSSSSGGPLQWLAGILGAASQVCVHHDGMRDWLPEPAFVEEVVSKKLRDHPRSSDLGADWPLPKCAGEPAGGPAASGVPVNAACPAAAGLPGARAVLLAVLAGPSGRAAGPDNCEQEHVRV